MKRTFFTRLKSRFWRAGMWLTRVRNALSGSIIVTIIHTNGEILGESVYAIHSTMDGKLLEIVYLDGSVMVIPFEKLSYLLATAY